MVREAEPLGPMPLGRLRVRRLRPRTQALRATLDRECAKLGTRVVSTAEGRLRLAWPDGSS